jgi:hypothetical protein
VLGHSHPPGHFFGTRENIAYHCSVAACPPLLGLGQRHASTMSLGDDR